ncbi:MAG: hypothetical protein JJ899_00295 [Alphaproteobacteria bacterium]|nr:hypothetical protein [Alphaproteobacteria bacterium]
MTRAYVIIGNPESRKSSVMRALTGASGFAPKNLQNNVKQVALKDDRVIDVFVFISSMQEGEEGEYAKSPGELIADCDEFPYVLLPLWVKEGKTKNLPDFKGYFDQMGQSGWIVENIAVLGHRKIGSSKNNPFANYNMPAPTIYLPHSASSPTNLTASKIRTAWGWM